MKSSRSKRIGLLAATAVLALGIVAPVASASIELTPEAPGPYEDGQTITVSGEAPLGTTQVAVVTCNATATLGTRCDGAHDTGLVPVAEYEEGVSLELDRGPWFDWTFITGMPKELKTKTTCLNTSEEGEPCVVAASFYAGFVPNGDDDEPIVFE